MVRVLVLALSSILLLEPSGAAASSDPYQSVPLAEREQFAAVAQQCIALTKASEWRQLYGLIDQKAERISEAAFIIKNKELARLVEFTVYKVVYLPPSDSWVVIGCARYDPHVEGVRSRLMANFKMRRSAQGWRTGMIAIQLDSEDPMGIGQCEEFSIPVRQP